MTRGSLPGLDKTSALTGGTSASNGGSPSPASTDADWTAFLSRELRGPVRVVWTRARRMPIQVRRTAAISTGTTVRAYELRMHALFAGAPCEVREAVAKWARSGKRAARACEVLDRWVAAELARLPPPRIRDESLKPRGAHHDLAALALDVLGDDLRPDFSGRERVPRVTWGRPGRSRTRHSLRLGSLDPDTRVARIHPVLDQAAVPDWFVRYVVFHELLHAVYPPARAEGRWVHHGAAFRRREREYPDYARALAWEEAHMSELVRSARRGEPMRVRSRRRAVRAGFLQRLLFPD